MKIARTRRQLGLAIAAGLAVVLVGSDAMAWSYGSWGSSGGWGSSASYGSYGSSGSSGSYGSHGRMGLFARMRARRAARRASHGSYGSSGSSASYGSYGSSGSSASYGSYGSTGSSGSAGSYASYSSTPVEYSAAKPVATTDVATIKVTVPEDAQVVVNDSKTTSTGTERSYVSRGLQAGKSYTYNFQVTYAGADGKSVTEDRVVKLRAGDVVPLSFGLESQEEVATAPEADEVETKLTLEVPENAKVFLLGAETKQTGTVRTFTTKQLKAGKQWDGYQVRVELEKGGQTLVREEQLQIEGGQSYELAFQFDSAALTQIAQLDK